MVQQLAQQAQPAAQPVPTSTPAGVTPGSAAGPPVTFSVLPSTLNQSVGSTFQVSVALANGRDIFSVPLQMKFNPAVLQLVNVDSGDFLRRDNQLVSISHRDDGAGLVAIATERPPNSTGVNGQGSVCILTFKSIAAGDSELTLVKVGAHNSAQANLPAVGSQAVVHVK
jgi:general secretion pathway protein D